MRSIALIVVAAVASVSIAGQPETPGCHDESAVACLVDHAQARLRACLLVATPSEAARTDKPPTRPAPGSKQRQDCVAESHREVDPLYREALTTVRYERGTTRAVKDYYEDWEQVIEGREAPSLDSTAGGNSLRADIERLNVKAEHLRQGR